MKVLHLLYEPAPSGISRVVLEVVRAVPGVEHAVVLPAGLSSVTRELAALGVVAREVPMRSRVLPRTTWSALPRAIREARADIVHLHSLETGLFGTLAAALGGASRVVFHPQTTDIRRTSLQPLFRALLGLAARRHLRWLAVSRGQAAFMERFAPGRVRFVPNMVPDIAPAKARDEARRQLGWPQDAFVVMAPVRLAAQKDPLTFVRAAEALPGVRFVLVGDGPMRRELELRAARAPNLRLQGHLPSAGDAYVACDAMVLPSRWEGMSLALLEALARGLPCVVTAIDGNTDLVLHERTGLLVEPGDACGLAAAVARLAADPALGRRLGEAGRAHVLAHNAPSAVAASLTQVYTELLG